MRVLKFGGTSVANAECFIRVVNILENYVKQDQIAVVLSAPAKITNYLISIIKKTLNNIDIVHDLSDMKNFFLELINYLNNYQIKLNFSLLINIIDQEFNYIGQLLHGISLLRYCPDSINAVIICLGEKLSIILMKELLISRGFCVTIINPVEKLLAHGGYLASVVDIKESTKRIKDIYIPKDNIILMAGFIAGNKRGELVALGRNGSDYSAAVLAACLRASCCEIWTDVDGVYTCDPRQVPDAQLLSSLSYQEAMELAYFGAQVLHPRTILPIAKFEIPCLIKNFANLKSSGTLISSSSDYDQKTFLKGITSLNNMSMIHISGSGMKVMFGISSRVFSAISSCIGCSVILTIQSSSKYNISFCISSHDLSNVCRVLEEEFYLELKNGLLDPLNVLTKLSVISLVGENISDHSILPAKLFSSLSRANINVIAIAQGLSKHSISVVVNNTNIITGMRVVHQALFNNSQIIEVFIIGIGGVGCALIEQIRRQYDWLKKKHIDLRVCGIANSRVMIINVYGIDLSNWKQSLMADEQEVTNVEKLINLTTKYYFFNPVIVDCTSSIEIAERYVDFLIHGFHVVTPNKKANTSSMDYYRKVRDAVTISNRKFFYDTNVGAGLPVIDNLQNLLNAGDELICFSGILSGSLSFIFGKLDEGMSFSEATIVARQRGYTEPDPREDLSGIDVARKLLVLAREIGCQLELQDISIKSVLPIGFDIGGDIDSFLSRLSCLDHDYFIKASSAHAQGCVLRYIGSIHNQCCCEVKIEEVDSNNPFFKIKDGENALAFFTRYYQPLPLVLRGYGAGNNVTAAGVFADLLRTLSSVNHLGI